MALSTETFNMEIFLSELPDSSGSIFLQADNKELTFHPFPRFPAELRLRIYRLMFPPTRKVVVKFWTEDGEEDFRHEPNPVTLSINQESRAYSLETYRPLFKFRDRPREDPKPLRQYCYSQLETLFFVDVSPSRTHSHRLKRLSGNASIMYEGVRRLELHDFNWFPPVILLTARPHKEFDLFKFPNLKHLTMVAQRNNWYFRPTTDPESVFEEARGAYVTWYKEAIEEGITLKNIPEMEIRLHPRTEKTKRSPTHPNLLALQDL